MAASMRSDQIYGYPDTMTAQSFSPIDQIDDVSCLSFEAMIMDTFRLYLASTLEPYYDKGPILEVTKTQTFIC